MNYNKSKGQLELAKVSVGEKSAKTYIRMDISSDYFIGYDTSERKTVHIPKDQISAIQTYRAENFGSKIKYTESRVPHNSDGGHMIQSLRSYYDIMTGSSVNLERVETLQSIVIDPFSRRQSFDVEPNILLKYMDDGNLHGRDIKNFYGAEMSVPEKAEKEKNGTFRVLSGSIGKMKF
ncbi:hypothetical protein OMP38_17020 [Cohnella ginsengisoli]|uniref:Uncharacterized protein n=1 Tax=Cohnella ginsengisoli TaxID=425004 RepID=A0A9X4QNG4_9BACL|nr:hypothetical protein [Cohnella ginsengisoli]MDG0792382.1 hypothetical protein [Cohnella ginsengisoli]